jgi:hypothetical protein
MKLLTMLLLLVTVNGFTQTAEDSVKQTISNMFQGMKSADRALLQSVFADRALLQTVIKDKQSGAISVRNEPIRNFIEQISKLPKDAADERITFDMVKVDADLASVWTPYQFYYQGKFSHCGVNSFQLVRINGSWKIQYIIDTRRKDNCVN